MRDNTIKIESNNTLLPWVSKDGIYRKEFFLHFLQWQLNDMIRGKKKFSIVSIALKEKDHAYKINQDYSHFYNIVKEQVRNTDFCFHTDEENKLYIILLYTGLKEVNYLSHRLQRLFTNFINRDEIELVEAILEIQDGRYTISAIMTELEYLEGIAVSNESKRELKILQKTNNGQLVKIAIVDDNELTHTILKNIIYQLNIPYMRFEVSSYKSGEEYLQSATFRSAHLQLVLISDILPERDGIEILQQLRSLPNESKYFVIVLGSRNTEEEFIYALEQGADDYVAKPFNINLLIVKIKRMLQRGI